jgi:hypothetical protein
VPPPNGSVTDTRNDHVQVTHCAKGEFPIGVGLASQ